MNLHQFQIDAVSKVMDLLEGGKRRVMLCSPTGSGKTVMAVNMIQRFIERGERVLFVVHRRELVNQCRKKLTHCGLPHGVIMSGEKESAVERVQVASVQTLSARGMNTDATVIFIDEAHHAVSSSYLNLLERASGASVIGLTATPARLDRRAFTGIFDELVVAATIPGLIEGGFLVKPVVYGFPFEAAKARVKAGDYVSAELNEQYGGTEVIGKLVENWHAYALGRKTIAYAANVAHALHIAEMFASNGVAAVAVDYHTGKREREDALKMLGDGRLKMIVNCGLFTEGIDIPDVSCVLLSVPTLSVTKYLQMIGRSLRVAEGKTDAVILDHGGNYLLHGLPTDNRVWDLEGRDVRHCTACNLWFYKGKIFYLISNPKKTIMACPACYSAYCECGNTVSAVEVGGDSIVKLMEMSCQCGHKYSNEDLKPGEGCVAGERKEINAMLELVCTGDVYPDSLYADFNNDFMLFMRKAKELRFRHSYVRNKLIMKYGQKVTVDLIPKKHKDWWNRVCK